MPALGFGSAQACRPRYPIAEQGKTVNVHREVGTLLSHIGESISGKMAIPADRARNALRVLKGQPVPLPRGTRAFDAPVASVPGAAFRDDGVLLWTARSEGSTRLHEGFGPDGSPGRVLVEANRIVGPVRAEGTNEFVWLTVASNGKGITLNWGDRSRAFVSDFYTARDPKLVAWIDGLGLRHAAVFGSAWHLVTFGPEKDGVLLLGINERRLLRTNVLNGHIWITTERYRGGSREIYNQVGTPLVQTEKAIPAIVAFRDSVPRTVFPTDAGIRVGDAILPNTGDSDFKSCDHGRALVVITRNARKSVLHDVERNRSYEIDGDVHNVEATATHLFARIGIERTRLWVVERAIGRVVFDDSRAVESKHDLLHLGGGILTGSPSTDGGEATWHTWNPETARFHDTGISVEDNIEALPNGRLASWRFVDGTLYIRTAAL